MSERFADQGLVILGIHSTKGGTNAAAFVEQQKLPYPIAIDVDNQTVAAYHLDGYPDYYLVDRSGVLRVADLANGDVERAVQVLLAEPAAKPVHPALAKASAQAVQKDKRLLLVYGDEAQQSAVQKQLKTYGKESRILFNEYEVVTLDAGSQNDLAKLCTPSDEPVTFVVLDAHGTALAQATQTDLVGPKLGAFLEKHRVPAKDAETKLSNALAQAERNHQRVLVHLGAPW